MWDLAPSPGTEPESLALGALSLNHWISREVLWGCITLYVWIPLCNTRSFCPKSRTKYLFGHLENNIKYSCQEPSPCQSSNIWCYVIENIAARTSNPKSISGGATLSWAQCGEGICERNCPENRSNCKPYNALQIRKTCFQMKLIPILCQFCITEIGDLFPWRHWLKVEICQPVNWFLYWIKF